VPLDQPTESAILKGREWADVCVVGGGYTGLWSAIHLKRRVPELRVLLLEANVCGSGASGANGGYVASWWNRYLALEALVGCDEARWLARESVGAITEISNIAGRHDIDLEIQDHGWIWAAGSVAQRDVIQRFIAQVCRPHLLDVEWISPETVKKLT
jgi:glycine/D-amino acid oxidase-like deaminating enzyme